MSGVQYGSGYGGLSSAEYFIRGFSSFQNSLRNGFPDFGFLSSRDVANIERIEFLKGPASVLYGLAEPGGRVNTITKQPLPYSYYATSMTFGSYDFYRPTLDLSGPLNADRSLLYRFNVRKAWELCHQTAHCPIKIILGATVWLEEKYQQSPQGNMLNEDDPSIVAEANNGFAFLPAEGTRLTVGYTMEW